MLSSYPDSRVLGGDPWLPRLQLSVLPLNLPWDDEVLDALADVTEQPWLTLREALLVARAG